MVYIVVFSCIFLSVQIRFTKRNHRLRHYSQRSPPSAPRRPLPVLFIHSLRPLLHSCPANRVTWTIFLDSMYMHYYTIFVFLLLTSLCMTDPRFIHLGSADASSLAWRSVTAQSGGNGSGDGGSSGRRCMYT